LFGHTLQIQVVSSSPVYRLIIDTYVHYWLEKEQEEKEIVEEEKEEAKLYLVQEGDIHLEKEQQQQQQIHDLQQPQAEGEVVFKKEDDKHNEQSISFFVEKEKIQTTQTNTISLLDSQSIDQKKMELQQMRMKIKVLS
jgi:hypothetical protein